jgi:hypothetical protein
MVSHRLAAFSPIASWAGRFRFKCGDESNEYAKMSQYDGIVILSRRRLVCVMERSQGICRRFASLTVLILASEMRKAPFAA